jgi:hypothetical protein
VSGAAAHEGIVTDAGEHVHTVTLCCFVGGMLVYADDDGSQSCFRVASLHVLESVLFGKGRGKGGSRLTVTPATLRVVGLTSPPVGCRGFQACACIGVRGR